MSEATSIPLTSKALVDREQLLALVDEMRASIPEDVQHAQEVLQTQDSLLDEARAGAQRIREEAEAAFRQRLDQHDLVRAAHEEAEKTISTSRQQADDLLARAQRESAERHRELNEYILQQLHRLETSLNAQLTAVRTAIDGAAAEEPRPRG